MYSIASTPYGELIQVELKVAAPKKDAASCHVLLTYPPAGWYAYWSTCVRRTLNKTQHTTDLPRYNTSATRTAAQRTWSGPQRPAVAAAAARWAVCAASPAARALPGSRGPEAGAAALPTGGSPPARQARTSIKNKIQ